MILRHSISKRNNVFYFLGAIELPKNFSELKEFGLYFSSILSCCDLHFLVIANPIRLEARYQGKAIEKGFQACGTTFWRRLLHNSD